MIPFLLDTRLANDSILLFTWGKSQLRLINNQQVTWFILVPETDKTEFYELPEQQQHELLRQINQLSQLLKGADIKADKINVATIGNVVEQMHIHIIGRKQEDYCWPQVVWGADGGIPYTQENLQKIKQIVASSIQHSSNSITEQTKPNHQNIEIGK